MIDVQALTKHRGRRAVVSDVTFRCEPGTVTGFLGPNGAGKTTTLRMLIGLSAPDSGRALVLGGRYRDLGPAHALLVDPEVLILDEPANGLDPEGMRWMRRLLRDFADRGGTVFLSSHLLYEVEAIADRLVIIGGGRIAAQGSRADLLAGAGTLAEASDEAALLAALDAAGLPARAQADGGFIVDAEPEDVGRAALAGDVALTRLGPSEGAGLEQLFFDLTTSVPDAAPAEFMEAIR
jgi:ABC-2 type transport system ATP-binding protein